MRSHSDPAHPSIAPSVARWITVGARPIPSAIYWLLALAVGAHRERQALVRGPAGGADPMELGGVALAD